MNQKFDDPFKYKTLPAGMRHKQHEKKKKKRNSDSINEKEQILYLLRFGWLMLGLTFRD